MLTKFAVLALLLLTSAFTAVGLRATPVVSHCYVSQVMLVGRELQTSVGHRPFFMAYIIDPTAEVPPAYVVSAPEQIVACFFEQAPLRTDSTPTRDSTFKRKG